MQISHNGTTIDVPVTAKAVHKATLMKEDYIKLVFDSDVDYKFKAGDSITIDGMAYYLSDDYFPTMKDEATFSYELQFNAPWYNLGTAMFLFNTYENGVVVRKESDWYITDTAANILNLLARSTESRSDCPISLVFCEPTVAKTFTFSSTSIIGALNMLAKEFELEWWFTYENGYFILHFGECDNSVYTVDGEVQFSDGARVKDPSVVTQLVVGGNVTKPSVSQNNGLRRFYYVFGSSRNIDQTVDVEQANNGFITSIVTKRLALAGNPQDLIEGSGEEVVIFDDIYPRSDYQITGVTPIEIQSDEYIGDDIEGNPQYKKYNVYNLKIDGFSEYVFGLINDPNEDVQNIEDIVASGKALSIKFITKDHEGQTVTPKLAGFEFEVGATLVTDEATGNSWYEFQIIKQDINGYIIPNNTLIPEVGDWVCVYNVKGKYIDGNSSNNSQTELLNAFNKWYANKKRDVSYTVKPFADSDLDLELGDAVELSYSDNIVLSRVYSYEKHLDYKIDASYTISSYAKMGSINQLKDDVKILAASIANGTATGIDVRALNAYLRRLFLSKTDDDTAAGHITFLKGLTASINGFVSGWLGSGARINNDGRAEFEEVTIRGALRAAEIVFNRISAEEGEAIRSIGHGEIETVDTENCTATLKLEGDEWATIDVGDICRGLYNTIDKSYTTTEEGEDDNGFRKKKGFFASYFYIKRIISSEIGRCEFEYGLQDENTEHPCPLMKFAAYGNIDDTKKARQSCMYITSVGIAPRVLFLAGVNTWQIKPWNIKVAIGNIDGLQVYEKISDGEYQLKELYGDAGLYVEDNIYLGGIIQQFIAANIDELRDLFGGGISAELLRGSDNIVVDALGNVVDGIYTVSTDGVSVNKRYKLHTGILVYDSNKKKYLRAKAENDNTELTEEEYRIYYTCDGCEVLRDGADFYITHITNTNDGLSGTTLTDDQLSLMRMTNECRVNFVIVTASGWRTQVSYPVKITHLNEAYVTFDIENDFDSMSYKTQTGSYEGLPITTKINARRNGVTIPLDSVTVANENMGTITVASGDDAQSVPFGDSGLICTLSADGTFTITNGQNEVDLEDMKHQFEINCVAKYAGVLYESGKRVFTVQETTDSTLYKLQLSSNAILRDEGSYTPDSIDVKVQIFSDSGMVVVSESDINDPNGDYDNVSVKYVNGVYDPNGTNTFLDTCPQLNDVVSCFNVLVFEGNTVRDVQTVTINSAGHDGAGQAYVDANIDQIVIECDSEGRIKAGVVSPVQITASLYWGTSKCVLDSNCSFEYNGVSSIPTINNVSNTAVKSYSFAEGDMLPSSNIVIILTGHEVGDPTVTHTARKTITVFAPKQGDNGNSVESVDTYYLLSIFPIGVEAPNGNPTQAGWSDNFSEPTEELPYLWRFTRYTFTDGEVQDTDCELIATYSKQPNYNLLDDTSFLASSMDAWKLFYYNDGWSDGNNGGGAYHSKIVGDNGAVFTFGVDVLSKFRRHNSYKVVATGSPSMSDGAYVEVLAQTVFNAGEVEHLDGGTWYTLSFWHKGASVVARLWWLDAEVQIYKDGVLKNALYEEVFDAAVDWTFHTLTIKSRVDLSGDDYRVEFRMPLQQVELTARICMPKLEIGQIATEYLASVDEQLPMPLRTVWEEGQQFFSGAVGERYFHLANYNRNWYRCVLSHISSQLNKPDPSKDTIYWKRATNIPFLASGLLLADEGVVDLLYSNRINLYNTASVLTASLNADNNGSYCIYYPSGRKRMEFSYNGFIYYYNDNEANTEKWHLGGDGEIVKANTNDTYTPLYLAPVDDSGYLDTLIPIPTRGVSLRASIPNVVGRDSTFNNGSTYYQFKWGGSSAGNSQYHDKIYKTTTPTLSSTNDLIEDGWYTQNTHSYEVIINNIVSYAITVHKIVGGKIRHTFEVTQY